MSLAVAEKEKIVKTFSDTNYFARGTYKRDFLELFSTSALANYLAKTLLAPLERWRIIKQTQLAYELRPAKFSSFPAFLASTPLPTQRPRATRASPRSGGATLPTAGCTSGRSRRRSSSWTPSAAPSTSSPSNCRRTWSYPLPHAVARPGRPPALAPRGRGRRPHHHAPRRHCPRPHLHELLPQPQGNALHGGDLLLERHASGGT